MKLYLYPLLFIITASLALASICCSSSKSTGSVEAADLIGIWELYDQSGPVQDVCANETLGFSKDGKATLQCPGSTPLIRLYSVRNGILTYTETGIKFKFNIITSKSNIRLELFGQNVGRNLFYKRINSKSGSKK